MIGAVKDLRLVSLNFGVRPSTLELLFLRIVHGTSSCQAVTSSYVSALSDVLDPHSLARVAKLNSLD